MEVQEVEVEQHFQEQEQEQVGQEIHHQLVLLKEIMVEQDITTTLVLL
jgi:hypothetical protein